MFGLVRLIEPSTGLGSGGVCVIILVGRHRKKVRPVNLYECEIGAGSAIFFTPRFFCPVAKQDMFDSVIVRLECHARKGREIFHSRSKT